MVGLHSPWCGAGAGLNIEVCGAGPRIGWCGVMRVRASSLRGGAVVGQTFRAAQGSNTYSGIVCGVQGISP